MWRISDSRRRSAAAFFAAHALCGGAFTAIAAGDNHGTNAEQSVPSHHVAAASNALGWDIYRCLAKERDNFVLSPFSAFASLAILHAGSEGAARDALGARLCKGVTHEEILPACGVLRRRLERVERDEVMDTREVALAFSLWRRKGEEFRSDLVERLARSMAVDLGEFDPAGGGTGKTSEAIDRWLGRKTRGQIRELGSGVPIDGDTQVLIVATSYFRARWRFFFSPGDSKVGKFHCPGGRGIDVVFMQGVGELNHASADGYAFLEIPLEFKDLDVVFAIFLPDAVEGLPAVEMTIDESGIGALRGRARKRPMDVRLPRFCAESAIKLEAALTALGLGALFDRERQDVSRMLAGTRGNVAQASQAARMKVDELGVEAVTVTAFGVTCADDEQRAGVFNADHPFAFAILERKSNVMLYVGRLAAPEEAHTAGGVR